MITAISIALILSQSLAGKPEIQDPLIPAAPQPNSCNNNGTNEGTLILCPRYPILGKYVCVSDDNPKIPNTYGILVEFGVTDSETRGFAGFVEIDQKITKTEQLLQTPGRRAAERELVAAKYDYDAHKMDDKSYSVRFTSPSITKYVSEYIYLEANFPIKVVNIGYLEDPHMLGTPSAATSAFNYKRCNK